MLVPQARSAKDFFLHLLQDSQPRAAILAERERWLRSVRVDGREERLFELEMLLRGVERAFNLHNLGFAKEERVVNRDFRDELADVRDALHQATQLARQLLDPDADQKRVFRRYLETQLADDRLRRALLEEGLEQSSPQESLFAMRQSFLSLRLVIDHLLLLDGLPYALFQEVGNLALRDIVLNHYFRPFRALEFRIEYDRVKSVHILEALRQLPDPDRRRFTLAFLALFRVLHYLAYVQTEGEPPRRARVVLALVRSEVATLVGFAREELGTRAGLKRHQSAALRVARELEQGARRILKKGLPDGVEASADLRPARAAAASFTDLCRRQVTTLAVVLDVRVSGDDLFAQLVSPTLMAQRLRLDLWLFSRMCHTGAEALDQPRLETARAAWAGLIRFVAYFHDVSYQLLRYGDYEPVDRFTGILLETESCPDGPVSRARLGEDCRLFSRFAAETFTAVGRRATLRNKRFDPAKATFILARFQANPVAR